MYKSKFDMNVMLGLSPFSWIASTLSLMFTVNTFLNKNGSPTITPTEVIRSTNEEKEQQIQNLKAFQERNKEVAADRLHRLKQAAINHDNLFAELMETVKYCSLGQITNALYEVGGQYRRNM